MGVDTFGVESPDEAQEIHVLSAREWGEIWGNSSKVSPPENSLGIANLGAGLHPTIEVKFDKKWL